MRQLPAPAAFGSVNLKSLPSIPTPTGLSAMDMCCARVGVAARAATGPTHSAKSTRSERARVRRTVFIFFSIVRPSQQSELEQRDRSVSFLSSTPPRKAQPQPKASGVAILRAQTSVRHRRGRQLGEAR